MNRLSLIEKRLHRVERTLGLPPLPVFNCMMCNELVTEGCERKDCSVTELLSQRAALAAKQMAEAEGGDGGSPASMPASALQGEQEPADAPQRAEVGEYPAGVPGGQEAAPEPQREDPDSVATG